MQSVRPSRSRKTSFGYFNKQTKIALASLAIDTGKRPSELVSWNENEDWLNRLLFDFDVMKEYHEEEARAQKKAMKKRR